MKTGNLIKTLFLVLPLLVWLVNWISSRSSTGSSIGGGYYDTGSLFYLVYSIAYFVLFEIVLLCMGIKQNSWFLAAGGVMLLAYIIYAVININ